MQINECYELPIFLAEKGFMKYLQTLPKIIDFVSDFSYFINVLSKCYFVLYFYTVLKWFDFYKKNRLLSETIFLHPSTLCNVFKTKEKEKKKENESMYFQFMYKRVIINNND